MTVVGGAYPINWFYVNLSRLGLTGNDIGYGSEDWRARKRGRTPFFFTGRVIRMDRDRIRETVNPHDTNTSQREMHYDNVVMAELGLDSPIDLSRL